jgi:hypothetical protein
MLLHNHAPAKDRTGQAAEKTPRHFARKMAAIVRTKLVNGILLIESVIIL